MIEDWIWLLQLVSCSAMTGIIWLVQLLIYPGFLNVHDSNFKKHHQDHMQRITWIVAPLMILEMLTAIGSLILFPSWIWFFGFLGVLALWALTAIVSIPLHDKLVRTGFELPVAQQLIRTNWYRTVLWSLRLIYLVIMSFVLRLV